VRLFVGIVPPPEAISHAAGAVDRIASTTPDMRWVPSERWHLTLAFLGEVEPDLVPDLVTRLDQVAAAQTPLEAVRLAGSGTFPGVLWLGIGDVATELRAQSAAGRHYSPEVQLGGVAKAIQAEMRAAGIHVERRPWRAHLTIARWRPSAERDAAAQRVADNLADYAGPAFDVHEFHLVHSVTGPAPRHTGIHIARQGG
jgi:2'-5' RNA ligase